MQNILKNNQDSDTDIYVQFSDSGYYDFKLF
jgi:hypothetical protein